MASGFGDLTREELELRLAAAEARIAECERTRMMVGATLPPSGGHGDGALSSQAQQAQKLESLGALAGGIAHDFNNLLCGILGGVELAVDELDAAHPARADLDIVQRTAREATELCRQLLAYSGKGRFVIEPVELSELVGSMQKLLRVTARKNVNLRLDLARGLPAVTADASQLRHVVINLVANASEAIGAAPGTITVCTGLMTCDDVYLRTTYLDDVLRPGAYVFVEVADNGCGMDAATRERIFDPFFSTKFVGRGLGLAAVQGIVRGHAGAIKVYSEVGSGTTIKILFPASAEAAAGCRPAPTAPGWRGHGLVLLVDDEPVVRAVGTRILERLGFEVLTAADGVEALEAFEQVRDRVVLIILDMTMPNLGGAATYRQLRARDPGVRVVLTSGYNEQEATSHFNGKGLAAFVQKPFQLESMRSTLERVLSVGEP